MARPPVDDDDLPWLAEGVREERSTLVPRARLFGGALVAVVLAVLVGLGVYLVSGHKSDGSSGYARAEDAPLIAADAGAYKIAPTDPGGAQITGIDDSVAAVAGGRDQGSAILPDEPEEPLARPGTPAAPPTDLLPATIPPATAPPAAVPTPRAIAPAPVVAPTPPVAAKPAPVTPARPTAAAAPVKPKVEATTPRPDAARTDAPPKPKAHDADPLAAIGHDLGATSPVAAHAGHVALQLGAFSTRDKADAAWTKAGGDGALTGLTKRIEPVDRDGTTLYRLRAGGVASPDAAKALCGRIRSAGNACIVAE